MERQPARNELIVSYLTLRKAIGWIGIVLPVALIVGNQLVFSGKLPQSVSDYYYTHMRNWLEGSLFVLGVFLLLYNGYEKWDRWITNAAGLFLLGVAFVPTPPRVKHLSTAQHVTGTIHITVAALAFVALTVMAVRFTKTKPNTASTQMKRARNLVYWVAAIVMAASLVALGVIHLAFDKLADTTPVDYVFESIAIIAFGISWLVKGETLLKDR